MMDVVRIGVLVGFRKRGIFVYMEQGHGQNMAFPVLEKCSLGFYTVLPI